MIAFTYNLFIVLDCKDSTDYKVKKYLSATSLVDVLGLTIFNGKGNWPGLRPWLRI
jgi:hypothetical protein